MVDALEHGAIGSKSSYGRAGSIPAGSNNSNRAQARWKTCWCSLESMLPTENAGIAQQAEHLFCNMQIRKDGGSTPPTGASPKGQNNTLP